jgi:hypothetical protein
LNIIISSVTSSISTWCFGGGVTPLDSLGPISNTKYIVSHDVIYIKKQRAKTKRKWSSTWHD